MIVAIVSLRLIKSIGMKMNHSNPSKYFAVDASTSHYLLSYIWLIYIWLSA